MEAIILAGGFGTRLSHIITDVPKPMAPVAEKPFLQILLDQVISQGVTRIILAVGYKYQSIMDYFGDNYREIPLIYSVEDSPLFTGGAVKKALTLCLEPFVFVCNGDTFFDIDFPDLIAEVPTMALKELEHFDRYGQVFSTKTGKILGFQEKTYCDKGYINGGIYRLPRQCLESYPDCFSLETEFFPEFIQNHTILGVKSSGYLIDIGIPEDYYTAQTYFDDCTVEKSSVAFFDRDGTININFGHVYKTEDLEFIDPIPWYIRGYNHKNIPVLVVSNQSGIAKGYYSTKEVERFHQYMNSRLEGEFGAHIDKFYFCPHHPDVTGNCDCRKPKIGLFLQATQDYSIDFEKSVMYGDKPWDKEAAEEVEMGRFIQVFHAENV